MPRSEKKFEQIRQNPIVFGSSSRFGGCPQSLGIRTRDLRWNTLFDRSCAHKSLWTRLVRIGLPVDTGPSSLTRRRAVCAAHTCHRLRERTAFGCCMRAHRQPTHRSRGRLSAVALQTAPSELATQATWPSTHATRLGPYQNAYVMKLI